MAYPRTAQVCGYPLLSQERVKLRTSNFATTFTGCIETKAHKKFLRKRNRCISRICPVFFRYPLVYNLLCNYRKNDDNVACEGGYLCGECGENFDTEHGVKSHMFANHMCEYENIENILILVTRGKFTITITAATCMAPCTALMAALHKPKPKIQCSIQR